MNILVVSNYLLYQDFSSSFVHQQAIALSKNNRVIVLVMTALGKKDPFGTNKIKHFYAAKQDNIEIIPVRYISISNIGNKTLNAKSGITSIKKITKILPKDFVPEIVHAHNLSSTTNIAAYISSFYHCPLVATTHGSDTTLPIAKGEGHWLKKQADKADIIGADSSKLKTLLASSGTKTEIITINNGYVPHKLTEKIEKDPFSIIQVGHLIESKRNEVTIRAFAKLKETFPQMKLKIIGEGILRQKLQDLCRELGVEDSVTFTGQLPNSEVFAEMCRSAYFVMASKPEGFGIVYLEAMAAGCVTVGTMGEGIVDVINSGENGFLVPADDVDAIVSVLKNCIGNSELYNKISEKGKTTAHSLDWSVNARKYTELYKLVLEKKQNYPV